MKIEYKIESILQTCLTHCPDPNKPCVMVGSYACCCCSEWKDGNNDENWIECNFKEEDENI